MLEKLGLGVVTYLIVMVALVIPGFFNENLLIFKSEKRNKAVIKWYFILGSILAITIAVYVVKGDY
ncbi:hypothetical protein [Brevibacillus sp. SYSU BS000544]|uniref:hypothetical protein n=1 Tax=Brevibacillus sp. SYSU BS000544 TaxID=3416443 RepID=UPI003CE48DF5